jgi:MFS transporter, ACS family, hexuronate transporter
MNRWAPAVSMLLVSLISYVDRSTLAILAPTILRETHLNNEQYGYIVLAFSIAYMLANPIWGWILDRAGLRIGMAAAVACWTAASVAHVFASGFWSFGVARAALGFGEGATFPGGLRTVVQTLPPEQRGRGLAVAYSGGSLGAAITPLIVTPILLWWGWRAPFWFTGLIGAAWLCQWAFISRRPEIRKRSVAIGGIAGPRWTDRRLWAFMCAYALGALPLGFVLYTASLYLTRALGCSQALVGKILWIPPMGWETGYFVWGWLCDRALRRGVPREAALKRLISSCAAGSLAFAVIPWLPNVAAVMLEMYVAMFVAAGFVVLSLAYATHVYSSDHAGLIAGAGAGSWSLIIGLMMPFFGRLFDQRNFTEAFLIAAAVPIAGYVGWLWLSRTGVRTAV